MSTDKTINYYNLNSKKFSDETQHVNFSEKHHFLLKHLKKGDHILDLGCGSGRDSKFFLNMGYKVTAIDGSIEMCKIASDYLGQEVICAKFEEIHQVDLYDGIWACASLLHLPYNELNATFEKLSKALKVNGYLYASFKLGDFEGDRNGRYFTDLNEDRLMQLVKTCPSLKIIEFAISNDVRVGRENEHWLNFVLKKNETYE